MIGRIQPRQRFRRSLTSVVRHSALAAAVSFGAAGPAAAADAAEETPAWDLAFGTKLTSDYVDRGYTNSDGGPAIQGYIELTAFDCIYAGVWASSVRYPLSKDLTDPAAEIDYYAGLRHSWDAFSLDVGALFYDYPGERKPYSGAKEIDYYELGFKPSYVFGETLTLTGQMYWSGDYANTGSRATFLSGGVKLDVPIPSLPDISSYISAELGHQRLGRTRDGFDPADYLTWNAGVGTVYKAVTVDVRYSASNLSRSECLGVSGSRNWCGDRVMASMSFDTTFDALK